MGGEGHVVEPRFAAFCEQRATPLRTISILALALAEKGLVRPIAVLMSHPPSSEASLPFFSTHSSSNASTLGTGTVSFSRFVSSYLRKSIPNVDTGSSE